MNKRYLSIVLVLLFVGVVTAGIALFVFPYDPLSPPEADDTGFTQEGVQEVVNANNKFAFDMYQKLDENKPEENLFFSPYSISSAFSMVYEGALGQTKKEIKDVLYFPEYDVLRPNSAAIYNQINKKDKSYTLRTGNALWVNIDTTLNQDYKNIIDQFYAGKAANLDFVNETEKSRETINDFIAKQTNNKIKNILTPQQDAILKITKLALTNAIYFLGDWKYQFDKKNTTDLDFYISSNNSIKVPMMIMTSNEMNNFKPEPAKFNYADLEKLQIIELPYKDDELSMIIILPKQGEDFNFETGEIINNYYTLDDIEISFEKFNEYKSLMKETFLDGIYLPKFKFETREFLSNEEYLPAMGMKTPFENYATFSMVDKDLKIGLVIHQAFIEVDEKGTEAAAATIVLMTVKSAGSSNRNVFKADHPFMFVIQEKQTGNILFIGRVIEPSS